MHRREWHLRRQGSLLYPVPLMNIDEYALCRRILRPMVLYDRHDYQLEIRKALNGEDVFAILPNSSGQTGLLSMLFEPLFTIPPYVQLRRSLPRTLLSWCLSNGLTEETTDSWTFWWNKTRIRSGQFYCGFHMKPCSSSAIVVRNSSHDSPQA